MASPSESSLAAQPFSLGLEHSPEGILLGTQKYALKLLAQNHLAEPAHITLSVKTEGVNLFHPGTWESGLSFSAKEQKILDCEIQPQRSGLISCFISGIRHQEIVSFQKSLELKARVERDVLESIMARRCDPMVFGEMISRWFMNDREYGDHPPCDGGQARHAITRILQAAPSNTAEESLDALLETLTPSLTIAQAMQDPLKADAIVAVIRSVYPHDPGYALELLFQIPNSPIRTKLNFEFFPILCKQQPANAFALINASTSPEEFQDYLILLAQATTLTTAIRLIEKAPVAWQATIRSNITPLLYEEKEIKQISHIDVPLGEVQYSFIGYCGPVSPTFTAFIQMGGVLSPNLLDRSAPPQPILLFPYEFPFPVQKILFQTFQTLVSAQLSPPSYIVFPTKNHLNPEDQTNLIQLLQELQIIETLIVVDILPFLNNNLIVAVGSSPQWQSISNRLSRTLNGAGMLLTASSSLQDNHALEKVYRVMHSSGKEIIPLLVSYNFFHEISLFGQFLKGIACSKM